MPDFSLLSSAYSALASHRRRTEIIGQNIANVDTPGYTRQRAELSAVGELGAAGVIAGARPPRGVDIGSISRLKDDLLEQQARDASSRSGSLNEQARAATAIELRLGGLGAESLSGELDALWNGFADVANNPASLGARQVVLQQAHRVAASVNALGTSAVAQHDSEVAALGYRIDEINDLAAGVAKVGQLVLSAKAAGTSTNELLDHQAGLINRLSELVDLRVRDRGDGTVSLYVDGHDLVSEGYVKPLALTPVADPALAVHGLARMTVTTIATGRELNLQRGQVAGLLTVANSTLPDHLTQLDSVAAAIARTVNAIHTTGQGLDQVDGRRLFDPEPATARTLAVSADIADDPRRLGAAATGGELLDNSVARRLAALGESPDDPGLLVDRLVTAVGTSVASLKSRAGSAETATAKARQARDSVSNVNLDEELTNLVESQRAFEAAARVLTTVDQLLDTLINRTGLVGR